MTQFPTNPPHESLQRATDSVIKAARKITPPGAAEQRHVPRASIEELNSTVLEDIRERFLKSRRDDRGPVEKALDLLDAPRNVILSTLNPDLERQSREAGNTGTFGIGRVYVKDLLGKAGMEPGLVRGIAGFVGDVALDPLTYVGPVGWGAKATTTGGRVAGITSRGMRGLKKAQKALGAGGAVADPWTAKVIEAAERHSTGYTKGFDKADLRSAFVGGKTPLKPTDILGAVGRVTGENVRREGGVIARALDDPDAPADLAEAVRDWYRQYGRGSSPGIRIGKTPAGKFHVELSGAGQSKRLAPTTSTIAHIPFTDVGIHVPAFTAEGKAALNTLTMARLGALGSMPYRDPKIAQVTDLTHRIQELAEQRKAVNEAGVVDPQVAATLDSESQTLMRELKTAAEQPVAVPPELDPQSVLLMGKALREADASVAHYRVLAESMEADLRLRNWLKKNPSDPELLDDRALRLVQMSDEDAENAAALQKHYAAAFEASADLAAATRQSVVQFASNGQKELEEISRGFRRSTDAITGYAAATPLKTAMQMAYPKSSSVPADVVGRIERMKRRNLGHRTGSFAALMKSIAYRIGPGSKATTADALTNLERELRAIADRNGVVNVKMPDLLSVAYALAHQVRESELGRPLYHGTTMEGEKPAGWIVTIQKAIQDGWLNPKGELWKDLTAYATKNGSQLMDTIRDVERAAGVLESPLKGYLPKSQTEAAAKLRRGQKAQSLLSPTGDAARAKALEDFQHGRTTRQARFFSQIAGKKVRIFEADRWAQTLAPSEIEAIPYNDVRDGIKQLRALLDEYDALPDRPPMLETDAFELNQLAEEGHFNLMFGTNESPANGFFDTNFATVMARRLGAHERAMARAMLSEILPPAMLPVNGAKIMSALQSPDGVTIDLGMGAQGKIVTLGKGPGNTVRKGIRVGDDVYRPLDADIADSASNPIIDLIDDSNRKAVYHEMIADKIEQVARMHAAESEPAVREMLGALDRMTAWWKSITLMHPSWMIVNAIGDTINFWLSDPTYPAALAKYGKDAMKAVYLSHNPELLRKAGIKLRDADAADLLPQLSRDRITDSNLYGEAAAQFNQNGWYVLPSRLGPWRASFKGASLTEDAQEAMRVAIMAKGKDGTLPRAKGIGSVVTDRAGRWFINPWFTLNQRMADVLRTVAYLSYRDKGWDHSQAVERVLRAGFDYADLTSIEKNVFRRMFPFYCVPDHSEILTRTGWKRRKDLVIGEDVLTHNVERDELEWQPCLDIAAFDHDQELTVIANKRGLRLECTDNHRWVVRRNRNFVKGKWYGGNLILKETHHLKKNDSILMTAEFRDNSKSLLTPEQARLYGWLLTDGYWRFRKTCNGKRGGTGLDAYLCQTPKKFLDEVREVAGGKEWKHPNGTVYVNVLRDRLEPLMPLLRLGKAGCENVPAMLSREAAEAMYDAMYKADGTVRGQRSFAAYPGPKRECFKLLAFMLGKRTSPNSSHGCYVSDRRSLKWNEATVTKEHYFGTVWCPKTANGTWVMRQNGAITISGNTFMRNNGAYQLKLLMERPIFAGSFPLLREAMEDATAGEAEIPMYARPRWMREQLAIQVGKNPDKASALLLGTALPQEQAFAALRAFGGQEGLQDFLRYFGSSLNPAIRAPLEIASGKEIYTDRTIGGDPLTSDLTPGGALLSQVRPIREAPRLAKAFSEQGIGAGLTRLAIGGRIQPMTTERVQSWRLREFRKTEEGLWRAIRAAERTGDQKKMLAANLELMLLYRNMERAGLGDEVPKWAQARVGELVSSGR